MHDDYADWWASGLNTRKQKQNFTNELLLLLKHRGIEEVEDNNEWNYVIGCGYVAKSGSYIGGLENLCFDNVEFSIKECIQNYLNFNNCAKEFHFDKIKKEN